VLEAEESKNGRQAERLLRLFFKNTAMLREESTAERTFASDAEYLKSVELCEPLVDISVPLPRYYEQLAMAGHWGVRVDVSAPCPHCRVPLGVLSTNGPIDVVSFPCGHSLHAECTMSSKLCPLCQHRNV